jgi:metallo-beta-lactamase family protein
MNLTFLGAAGCVTGSKTVVRSRTANLAVDCGLFQGPKALRVRNRNRAPESLAGVDAVVLTHAHIDHSGYLPVLVRGGWRGPIHCTRGTADLCRILLPDAAWLQEEEARHAARHGYSKHAKPEPLFTRRDAEKTLELLEPHDMHATTRIAGGVDLSFTRAGHILGASSVHLRIEGRQFVFSGDLGGRRDPVMLPPEPLASADILVLESTYGDRLHRESDPWEELAEVVRRTYERGGSVLIPAFAVGRTQTLLYMLVHLRREGRIPDLPVFMDSPMAIAATNLLCDHAADHRLDRGECELLTDEVTYVRTPEGSKALDASDRPMVLVSASGMASGGRVLHHLKALLPDKRHTVLFTGYQAVGTRGQALVGGASEVKIHGEYHRVRAEVAMLDSLSAHADYNEIVEWLRSLETAPARVLINHGEPGGSDGLRRILRDCLGWKAEIPELGETVEVA